MAPVAALTLMSGDVAIPPPLRLEGEEVEVGEGDEVQFLLLSFEGEEEEVAALSEWDSLDCCCC